MLNMHLAYLFLMRLFSDVQMEWSQPQPQGVLPTPRAGHAGVTIGDSWFIIGGGDNKSGKFSRQFIF